MSVSMPGTLRTQQSPLIRQLADCIEEVWHKTLDLSPYQMPDDLGYVEGHLEGERLVIENHCYQTTQFRKLHLELARVGNHLDILHCVMFPNPNYALPIFGADIVGARGNISAAIADLSPIRSDRALPKRYQAALSALPAIEFSQPRELPQWGDIFSDFCLFVRPGNEQEEALFLNRVKDLLTLHCQLACTAMPVTTHLELVQVQEGQQRYCTRQQENDKTRRVLEKSFGSEWTDRYMTTMLFDCVA
jgi:phycocyanobilin:ferredoxin oxidoreductase